MTIFINRWRWERRHSRDFTTVMVLLQIFLLYAAKKSDSVKVAIKSNMGDWCIRAQNSRLVTVEECYWKETARGNRESEQTFDIHPADVDDDDGENIEGTKQPVPFLIRVTRKQTNPTKGPSVATSCLASISTLVVEKCHLRKSRFRLTPSFPPKLQSQTFCSGREVQEAYESSRDVRYNLHSSDQLCLGLIVRNTSSTSNNTIVAADKKTKSLVHSLVFSKCSNSAGEWLSDGTLMMSQLWQFCTKNGICSHSLLDMKWSSLIKAGIPSAAEAAAQLDSSLCQKEDAATLTTIRTSTMEMDEFASAMDYNRSSTTRPEPKPTNEISTEAIMNTTVGGSDPTNEILILLPTEGSAGSKLIFSGIIGVLFPPVFARMAFG